MKRERQEFYFALEGLNWMITGISSESKFLSNKEQDIFFEGITKIRNLKAKLEKEYKKLLAYEESKKQKRES